MHCMLTRDKNHLYIEKLDVVQLLWHIYIILTGLKAGPQGPSFLRWSPTHARTVWPTATKFGVIAQGAGFYASASHATNLSRRALWGPQILWAAYAYGHIVYIQINLILCGDETTPLNYRCGNVLRGSPFSTPANVRARSQRNKFSLPAYSTLVSFAEELAKWAT